VRESPRETRLRLFVECILVFATAIAVSTIPYFFSRLVDELVTHGSDVKYAAWILLLSYIFAIAIGRLLEEFRTRLHVNIEQTLQRSIAIHVFKHVMDLPLRFHLDKRTGALDETIARGLMGFRIAFENIILNIVPMAMQVFVMALVVTFVAGFSYALILFVSALLYCLIFVLSGKSLAVWQSRAMDERVAAGGIFTDSVLNYETVKYTGSEQQIEHSIFQSLTAAMKNWFVFATIRSGFGIIQGLVIAVALGLILTFALGQVASGQMTVGEFVLLNTYVLMLINPLQAIGFAYREVDEGMAYLGALCKLFELHADLGDGTCTLPGFKKSVSLQFDNVSFSYGSERETLKNVSFSIMPGQRVGIVGASGSGKSTMGRLIFRFFDVGSGSIRVDGRDIREFEIFELRRCIGVVPQDTVLFNQSIRYNLTLGMPTVPEESLNRAIETSGLKDVIANLSNGLDTLVGERGLKLSGGERQRIAICRAVLKNPKIMLFDEATSSLDTLTENALQQNLERMSNDITTVIISHRLATVANADLLLVMDRGKIVERGTHNELLQAKGKYFELWSIQELQENAVARGNS
jgi:ATP-binding cassette, subfamily B, heavy metal transporter